MALVLADRVKETTTTTGTGTITLAGSDASFSTFAKVGDGNTTYYCISHQNADEFEIGIGTYTSSGTTLSRDTVLVSTNSDAKVDFSSGTKDVFVTIPEDKSVLRTAAGHISLPKYASGSYPSHEEATFFYDDTNKAMAVYNDEADITLQLGQEFYHRVYNNSGATITNGSPCYFSGNHASNPTIALANASDVNAYNVQGLATHDIENNSYGYITVAGMVRDIDTSGLTAGSPVFVGNVAGTLTPTTPTYPNYPMCVGTCIVSDANSGEIIVNQQNHSVNSFRVRTSAHIGSNLTVDGDFVVNGTQTIASTENVNVGAAFQYLNAGDTIGESNTTFDGSGLDDAFFSGHFSGTASTTYYVRIDGTGTPDTFEWSKDDFATTEATGVNITGSAQTLDNGIEIDFGATTGHTLGDEWSGTAAPTNVDTGFFSNRNTGGSGVGYTHIGLWFDVTDAKWKLVDAYDPEPTGTIDTADSSYSTGTLKADLDGNASTATTLETTRTFALTGDVTGSATFNGSANASIAATVTTANFSLTDFTNDISEVTTTTPTDATGKPNGYVWYVVS